MVARSGIVGFAQHVARANPSNVLDTILSAAGDLGASDAVVYLVDFEQQVLVPLLEGPGGDGGAADQPGDEAVDASIAGRAFIEQQPVTLERPEGTRVWVPLLEGSDPTGVLALTVKPDADEEVLAACQDLGALAGVLVASQARFTDRYSLHRRRKPMNLAASMQWDLLPPLSLRGHGVAVAGMLEPAYEVAGDCFDYALNGRRLDIAVFDAMGHGIRSASMAALAVGCYRYGRREGYGLEQLHDDIDRLVASEFEDAFVTGLIGRLDLDSGAFGFVNAGHPAPLLIRAGRVVGQLEAPRRLPWGLGGAGAPASSVSLEPDDGVLFYTDGVVEGRRPETDELGADRLADVIGRHASDQLSAGRIVRLITRAVLEHHAGRLDDDATVVLLRWAGPPGGAAPAGD